MKTTNRITTTPLSAPLPKYLSALFKSSKKKNIKWSFYSILWPGEESWEQAECCAARETGLASVVRLPATFSASNERKEGDEHGAGGCLCRCGGLLCLLDLGGL